MLNEILVYPFGPAFFVMIAFIVAFVAVCALTVRKLSEKFRVWFLCSLCALNIVIFFVYKYFLSIDAEFLALSGVDRFNWFSELPLHLCNINMFLIPLGILTKKRFLMGFSFVLAPLGAFMALIFPDPSFTGFSLMLPRILGYYITHILVMICGLLIVALGFFKPKFSDMPLTLLAFAAIALVIHGINTVLRVTGICPEANYFYTYGSDISLLAIFWKLLPCPYLYELPSILIAGVYMALLDVIFLIPEKKKKRSAAPKETTPAPVQR